jgi:hypothetical protein
MTARRSTTASLAAISCLSVTPASADPAIDAARAVVKGFAGALQAEVRAAMKAGSPVQAVNVCHSRAG